jgi:CRISPR-associated protein Cmr3
MKIKIDAIDTLFFKDGKPFSMGEETWADGIFPPPPSVIYGAITSSILSAEPELSNRLSDPTIFDDVIITDIYYRINNSIHFPMPLDIVYKKNKSKKDVNTEKRTKEYIVNILNGNQSKSLSSINQNILTIKSNEEVENLENAVLNESKLSDYLNGFLDEKEFVSRKLSDNFITESKVGIGRDNLTRTTEESKLYRVGMRRPKDLSIIVELSDTELTKELTKFIKFGAEGKIAKLTEPTDIYNPISVKDSEVKKFKLYLKTPTFFENGWLPNWVNKETLVGEKDGIQIKLITAFIGKPISIGGFDMFKKVPKPMRKAVPSGSVYCFEILNGNFKEVLDLFNNKSISEYDSQKYGYGISMIGILK